MEQGGGLDRWGTMKADQAGEPNAPEHDRASGRMEGNSDSLPSGRKYWGTKHLGKERSMLVG